MGWDGDGDGAGAGVGWRNKLERKRGCRGGGEGGGCDIYYVIISN